MIEVRFVESDWLQRTQVMDESSRLYSCVSRYRSSYDILSREISPNNIRNKIPKKLLKMLFFCWHSLTRLAISFNSSSLISPHNSA